MKRTVAREVAPLIHKLLGRRLPFRVSFWDGSSLGPPGGDAVVVRSPRALRRLISAPGELGLGRAYVAGELDVQGDLDSLLALAARLREVRLDPAGWAAALSAVVATGAFRPWRLEPPPEEARMTGPMHSRRRDAAAIAHHYDISNDFYRLVLGPSLTYSCAYFDAPDGSLDRAQRDKHELICRKLRLRPGERLLDVGCGWGTLVIHAAERFGVHATGVTLSRPQADLAAKRVAEAGLTDRVTIRVQDERDVDDGPYDAISSVGMFEHVGAARLSGYFSHLHALLRDGGRLLNHGISRPAWIPARSSDRTFLHRYVFPDGELHEIGEVVSLMQRAGFEVRDVESLREHYALTLRSWIANLEANRDECVRLVGEGRVRVWRMYMSVAASNFEEGRTQVHQVLGVKATGGRAGLPLRRSDTVLG